LWKARCGTVRIFIDGYNLIGAAERKLEGYSLSKSEPSREKLLGLLARYKSVGSSRMLVFFDGGSEGSHLPRRQFQRGLDVMFSDPKSKADEDIKQAVAHADLPHEIRVVTSDRAVQAFVTRFGAKVTESGDFLDEIAQALDDSAVPSDEPIEKYEGTAGGETDYWLRVFGRKEEHDDDE